MTVNLTLSQTRRAIEYNRLRLRADDVRRVQRIVGAEDDGIIGPRTVYAVALWQAANGLDADGMVGPKTRAALDKAESPPVAANAGRAVVAGRYLEVDRELRNWHAPGVERFSADRRAGSSVTEIVVHESVTRSSSATQRVLQGRGLGVHFMIDADGSLTQHGDPATDRMVHVASHNGPSVGVEVVNPYYPASDGSAGAGGWSQVIDAPWAHRDRYVVPTLAQIEALVWVVRWLLSRPELAIPQTWRGLDSRGRFMLDSMNGSDRADRAPGIWSHQQVGDHSDGGFPTLCAYLALERGLAVPDAYARAVQLATGSRGAIDVSSGG